MYTTLYGTNNKNMNNNRLLVSTYFYFDVVTIDEINIIITSNIFPDNAFKYQDSVSYVCGIGKHSVTAFHIPTFPEKCQTRVVLRV